MLIDEYGLKQFVVEVPPNLRNRLKRVSICTEMIAATFCKRGPIQFSVTDGVPSDAILVDCFASTYRAGEVVFEFAHESFGEVSGDRRDVPDAFPLMSQKRNADPVEVFENVGMAYRMKILTEEEEAKVVRTAMIVVGRAAERKYESDEPITWEPA